jgi:tRNA nucleotidyltransferase (CCA-adding enzyme)
VDGSISAARDDVYERPGSKPEHRWSTIMEDLRRRDFSINAVAISLNTNSRGLLLDPTNGLADLEKREVRALSIHAFTNQPIRLLRILRYCARMGFKMEQRTAEWFDLAMQRRLHESLDSRDVGQEVRQLARDDNPVAVLRSWESHGLLAAIHPQMARRKPSYDDLNRLAKVRESMMTVGVRPRLSVPVTYYLLKRLKQRERSATMRSIGFSAAEIDAIAALVPETLKLLKLLKGRKTSAARDAYAVVSKAPLDQVAFVQTEFSNPRAGSKIRNYLTKWRPLRLSLPVAELDALGIPRGPKFDKILEDLFALQLRGKGRIPPDRTKLLKQLAGIKEAPPAKPKPEKKKRKEKAHPDATGEGAPKQTEAAVAAAAVMPAHEKPAKPATKGSEGRKRAMRAALVRRPATKSRTAKQKRRR